MRKCDFCGNETDDYKVIPELDSKIMCQECLEKEIEFARKVENDGERDDDPYDFGYGGDGW